MLALLDILFLVLLVRVVIEIEKPLIPALIFAGLRLFFIPVSLMSGALGMIGLLISISVVFAVSYLYFWLLVRLRLGSPGWWIVAVSLPTLRFASTIPWPVM